MSINNAKHIVEEIDGVRCTIVEKGASAERMEFLKNLLEFNGLEVKIAEEATAVIPETPATGNSPAPDVVNTAPTALHVPAYIIGVTDLVFNPVFAIYERRLKTPEGYFVTPAIWKQQTTEFRPEYWMEGKKEEREEGKKRTKEE